MEEIEKVIRNFENTEYFGYIFYIEYDGKKFSSFDENPNEKSIKSEFRKLLEKNGIKIFKGIQQAGRTDKDVSAKENILYINSKHHIEFEEIEHKEIDGLKILKIEKTLPFLEFPELIEKRHYIYEYPEKLIKNTEEKIISNCTELSGRKNFKKFTSKKGEKLKNHVREIKVKYKEGKLHFTGDGFLPQQVRIMSSFILNGSMKPLPGEFLTLVKVDFSDKLKKMILKNENVKEISEDVEKIEKNDYFYIFYVNKGNKGRLIGKKGKNIKNLKKLYGNIVVKEKK